MVSAAAACSDRTEEAASVKTESSQVVLCMRWNVTIGPPLAKRFLVPETPAGLTTDFTDITDKKPKNL